MNDAAALADRLQALVAGLGTGPIFVHADLLHAGLMPRVGALRGEVLDEHRSLIEGVAAGRAVWHPAFNYRYLRTGRFDVRRDPSEVGPLSEHVRTRSGSWRSPVPVFSITGEGQAPAIPIGNTVDPFGTASAFAMLVERDGTLLFHGAAFGTATILHLTERRAGAPYRYDKRFPGEVVMVDGSVRSTTLIYHVRPLGSSLDYDPDRLLDDAVAAGICRRSEDGLARSIAASARALDGFWRDRFAADPLYPLDAASRTWAAAHLDRLGRPFVLSDFEVPVSP